MNCVTKTVYRQEAFDEPACNYA